MLGRDTILILAASPKGSCQAEREIERVSKAVAASLVWFTGWLRAWQALFGFLSSVVVGEVGFELHNLWWW